MGTFTKDDDWGPMHRSIVAHKGNPLRDALIDAFEEGQYSRGGPFDSTTLDAHWAVIEAAKAWADMYDPDDRYLIALEKAVEALREVEGDT